MNPTFGVFAKIMTQAFTNALMGIQYVPEKNRADPTEGKLFATKPDRDSNGFPHSDLVEAAEEAQKERKTRAYLDELAERARARSDKHDNEIRARKMLASKQE